MVKNVELIRWKEVLPGDDCRKQRMMLGNIELMVHKYVDAEIIIAQVASGKNPEEAAERIIGDSEDRAQFLKFVWELQHCFLYELLLAGQFRGKWSVLSKIDVPLPMHVLEVVSRKAVEIARDRAYHDNSIRRNRFADYLDSMLSVGEQNRQFLLSILETNLAHASSSQPPPG